VVYAVASEAKIGWREFGEFFVVRYFPIFVDSHLLWEALQLPLYKISAYWLRPLRYRTTTSGPQLARRQYNNHIP